MLRKRTLLKNEVQVPSIAWGSLSGSASGPSYNKRKYFTFTNFTTGSMVINFSYSLTKPWSDIADGSIETNMNGLINTIESDRALPFSGSSSVTASVGSSTSVKIALTDYTPEYPSYENLDFNVTITSATIGGVPVQITGDATWHMEY